MDHREPERRYLLERWRVKLELPSLIWRVVLSWANGAANRRRWSKCCLMLLGMYALHFKEHIILRWNDWGSCNSRYYAPTTIFVDEVDALASRNDDNHHDAARRFKSELLVQLDGILGINERIVLLATTNSPWYRSF